MSVSYCDILLYLQACNMFLYGHNTFNFLPQTLQTNPQPIFNIIPENVLIEQLPPE
jgi:hypothetical protein